MQRGTGLLCIPAFLQSNFAGVFSWGWEGAGWLLWVASLFGEHTADLQKVAWMRAGKALGRPREAVMNAGLWAFTRHPNYFGEWMVWNALIVTSVPALIYFGRRHFSSSSEPNLHDGQQQKANALAGKSKGLATKAALGVSLLCLSYGMHVCLTWWTGAAPAEYYSLRKRPDFAVRRSPFPDRIVREHWTHYSVSNAAGIRAQDGDVHTVDRDEGAHGGGAEWARSPGLVHANARGFGIMTLSCPSDG